jgi:hypothetical protein
MDTLKLLKPFKPSRFKRVRSTPDEQAKAWIALIDNMSKSLDSGAWVFPFDAYVISQFNDVLHEENIAILKNNGWHVYTPCDMDPLHRHMILISCVPKEQTAYPYHNGFIPL